MPDIAKNPFFDNKVILELLAKKSKVLEQTVKEMANLYKKAANDNKELEKVQALQKKAEAHYKRNIAIKDTLKRWLTLQKFPKEYQSTVTFKKVTLDQKNLLNTIKIKLSKKIFALQTIIKTQNFSSLKKTNFITDEYVKFFSNKKTSELQKTWKQLNALYKDAKNKQQELLQKQEQNKKLKAQNYLNAIPQLLTQRSWQKAQKKLNNIPKEYVSATMEKQIKEYRSDCLHLKFLINTLYKKLKTAKNKKFVLLTRKKKTYQGILRGIKKDALRLQKGDKFKVIAFKDLHIKSLQAILPKKQAKILYSLGVLCFYEEQLIESEKYFKKALKYPKAQRWLKILDQKLLERHLTLTLNAPKNLFYGMSLELIAKSSRFLGNVELHLDFIQGLQPNKDKKNWKLSFQAGQEYKLPSIVEINSSRWLLRIKASIGKRKLYKTWKGKAKKTNTYGLPTSLWSKCFFTYNNKQILDTTQKHWQKLKIKQQHKYIKIYQKEYARSYNLPVKKEFKVAEVRFDMIFIPPGRFWMGAFEEEKQWRQHGEKSVFKETKHKVAITRPFWMGKTEVTQKLWFALMKTKPWKGDYNKDLPHHPVNRATWATVVNKFLPKLPKSFNIPNEATWEYATRAGTSTMFFWGKKETYQELEKYAWFQNNSQKSIQPVAKKAPNPWGLYDVLGNVAELCHVIQYSKKSQVNPKPSGLLAGKYYGSRGSYFNGPYRYSRVAKRGATELNQADISNGLRLICAIKKR